MAVVPCLSTGTTNYGAAGDGIKADLLNHPEYIAQSATLAFQAAIWRWMTPIKSHNLQPMMPLLATGSLPRMTLYLSVFLVLVPQGTSFMGNALAAKVILIPYEHHHFPLPILP